VAGVVGPIAALADAVYATRNDSVRSAEPEVVAHAARGAGAGTVEVHPSVAVALDAARDAARPGDLVLVTGSLFTVGDAKRAL
jgi:folylpolyglutamate synthase/dihydropteroate synthase